MKTNLTKTDLTELLTPEEIEEIGYQYEMDKAEDQKKFKEWEIISNFICY